MRTLTSRLDTPFFPLLCAAIAYALFIGLSLSQRNYDPSRFVTAGDKSANPTQVPPNLYVLSNSFGYDGQFYYRIALDPFSSKQTEYGIRIDNPPYRYARIFYPFLTWVLSLGRPEAVPTVMILLNYLALCAIGGLGGVYAKSLGRHAGWGLLIAFYVGFLFSLARDLIEILAVCFLLASLVLVIRKHFVAATIVLTMSVVTREGTLLWAVAAGIVWFGAKLLGKPTKIPWYVFVVPLCVFALWQIAVTLHWGYSAYANGAKDIGIPLSGIIPFLRQTRWLTGRIQMVQFAEQGFLILVFGAGLYTLRSSITLLENRVAWVLYAVEMLCFTKAIWSDDWSFMRVTSDFYLFAALILIASPSRIKYPVLVAALAIWVFMFRDLIYLR